MFLRAHVTIFGLVLEDKAFKEAAVPSSGQQKWEWSIIFWCIASSLTLVISSCLLSQCNGSHYASEDAAPNYIWIFVHDGALITLLPVEIVYVVNIESSSFSRFQDSAKVFSNVD